MIIEQRPALLMNHLLTVKHTSMDQMMEHLHLSKRQISYDLEKINFWLKEKQLPPIHYKRTPRITVPASVVAYLREQQPLSHERGFIFTDDERISAIYLFLFIRREPISSFHLTQLLQVSKNTVISDIKKANERVRPFLVKIDYTRERGYHLKGTEFDKRVLLMNQLSKLLQKSPGPQMIQYLLRNAQLENHFERIYSALQSIEAEFSLQFVEERLKQFAYFLVFYYHRQQEGKFVRLHPGEMEVLKQDPIKAVAEKLMVLLSLQKQEDELCYLIIQLLGLCLGNAAAFQDDSDLLLKLCERLVSDFESKACISFERKNEVVETLYQHLKPAYFRMKYRIPIENPLLDQIKSEHKELYTIVKELLLPVEVLLNVTIPDEEIGFITIHFGAMLATPKQIMPQKKRAIVVCPSGVSSSLMVKHQIESLFSEIGVEKTLSLQEFEKGDLAGCDLIFSMVPLPITQPFFHVKPIMTPIEKRSLVNQVYQYLFGIENHDVSVQEIMQMIEHYADVFDENGLRNALSQMTFHKKDAVYRGKRPVLSELLIEEPIQIVDQISDWEEAIKVAAQPLLAKGVITHSYIEAMIDNVKTLGPYVIIGPEIAIPHARPEMGVKKVGMSYLKLNQPVFFLNNPAHPVSLLFCIAATDNTTHLKALSQLTKLLSEKDNVQLLKQMNSTEKVIELINQHSTDN